MAFGGRRYGGGGFGGGLAEDVPSQTATVLSVEVAFTTGALETPVWKDITADVRFWDVSRGRSRELEPFQPGRATVVLGNLSRQYDSVYASGPYFGNLRPMRRIRIRETFNGVTYPVFDGFVDKWLLDYPNTGKDATATVVATDAIKVFARTDLPISVYYSTVDDDAPAIWWRLDETQADPTTTAGNSGSTGSAGAGTYQGPVTERGVQGLIHYDPGTAIRVQDSALEPDLDIPDMGVSIDDANFDLDSFGSWAIEFWVVPAGSPVGGDVFCKDSGTKFVFGSDSSTPENWQFLLVNGASTVFGVTGNAAGQVGNTIYHVVAKYGPNRNMAVYVNGTKYTATASGCTAPPVTGTLTLGDLWFLYTQTLQTPEAIASNFAVYTAAQAVDPLTDAQVAAHYAAGTSPWQNDQPDDRLGRILDLVGWPADLRELDSGNVALQSAALGTTALEHLQKVADTEFGLLFIDRTGKVRFIDRAAQGARSAGPTVYGDGAGEVGYRHLRPDDGDEVIRNQATISRLNGVAQTATGTTIDEFGRFQYTLDGLLHRLDSHSASYAQFIVDEYENPRRRIVELTIGPPPDGDEALYYPAMLGPELGDAISVTHTPQGLGAAFEQTCVVEGIRHTSAPGRNRTTTFVLSPEFTETLF